MRSAPTLKIWMTPLASVAILEKFALLKIAAWRARVVRRSSALPVAVKPGFDVRELAEGMYLPEEPGRAVPRLAGRRALLASVMQVPGLSCARGRAAAPGFTP